MWLPLNHSDYSDYHCNYCDDDYCDYYNDDDDVSSPPLLSPLSPPPPPLGTGLLSAAKYYGSVSAEFARLVYRKEQLSPPTLDKWPQARQELSQLWQHVRGTNVADYTPAQLGRGALLALEVSGFFVVGEMVGRRQIIGYQY